MMMTRLLWVKRKSVAAVVVCAVLAAASIAYWQMNQSAQATIIYPQVDVPPTPVGWWQFDEGAGTVAKDSSGNGNDATVSGATWVNGKFGKALSFDGTDDYIVTESNLSFGVNGSIMLWLNASGAPDDWAQICGLYDPAIYVQGATKKPYLQTIINGSSEAVVANTPITSDNWMHVCATWEYNASENKTTLKIYINGALDCAPVVLDGAPNGKTGPFYVIKNSGILFKGTIDEVCIYNRALSAIEVQKSFETDPLFSSRFLTKIPKGTTQFLVTLSWQGIGSANVSVKSPSQNYTEDMVPVYQKSTYSSSSGTMLNIKRLAISVTALPSDEDWYIILKFSDVEDYSIAAEIQK